MLELNFFCRHKKAATVIVAAFLFIYKNIFKKKQAIPCFCRFNLAYLHHQ